MDVAKRDPYLMKVVINSATGKRKGLRTGDLIWVESRFAKAKGVVGLTEGIHPETAAVSGGFGRWTKHPVAHGIGVSQNAHLAIDLEYSGFMGGSMETVGKVRIYKCEGE
jgi:anaerobic selenocysteine-containing dehydrogenase